MDTESAAAAAVDQQEMEGQRFTQLVREVSGGSPSPSPSLSAGDTPRRVDIRAIRGNNAYPGNMVTVVVVVVCLIRIVVSSVCLLVSHYLSVC